MLTKVKEGKAIRSSLESIPGSAKEDKQQITELMLFGWKHYE